MAVCNFRNARFIRHSRDQEEHSAIRGIELGGDAEGIQPCPGVAYLLRPSLSHRVSAPLLSGAVAQPDKKARPRRCSGRSARQDQPHRRPLPRLRDRPRRPPPQPRRRPRRRRLSSVRLRRRHGRRSGTRSPYLGTAAAACRAASAARRHAGSKRCAAAADRETHTVRAATAGRRPALRAAAAATTPSAPKTGPRRNSRP